MLSCSCKPFSTVATPRLRRVYKDTKYPKGTSTLAFPATVGSVTPLHRSLIASYSFTRNVCTTSYMFWICTALTFLETKETTHYIPSTHALVVVVVGEHCLNLGHLAVHVFSFHASFLLTGRFLCTLSTSTDLSCLARTRPSSTTCTSRRSIPRTLSGLHSNLSLPFL